MKRGTGDGYDRMLSSDKTAQKLRAYFDLTKPASSVGVMLAIPFTAILFGELYHTSGVGFAIENWRTVFHASVALFLLHGGSQAMNMAEDAEMDRFSDNKENRPIPAGIISEEEARSVAWIMMMAGVTRAFLTSVSFGVFAVALTFFGIFYNLKPLRIKRVLWVNLGWQAASRGLLLYPAAFAAYGDPLNPVAWGLGVVAFFLVLAMQNTADFSDVDTDAKFGIITPAVHHGLDQLVKVMCGIVAIMFTSLALFIYLGIVPMFWSLLILAIPIGWSLYSLKTDPRGISEIGGNHASWYVFYFCLAGMYMFPALQLVIFS